MRRTTSRLAGWGLSVIGAGTIALGALGLAALAQTEVLASTGPPCGSGELCIKESQVPTTAVGFGSDCTNLQSAHPDMDLWHFVIPSGASFDTDTSHFTAIFSNPAGTVNADSIGGPDNEFAFVYSPAGATLTWAFATNVSGTPVQDYFVLSGTCAASQESSTSSSSTTTTETTTSSSTTSTTSSVTGSVSAASTDGGPTGGVQGLSITTPNTGSDEPFAVLTGLCLVGGGFGLVELGRRYRRRRRQ